MIPGSETLDLQISGIFGKYHHVPALFLCSMRVCFWLLLKQDPKLRGPLLWTNIIGFKFPKNGLWTRTFFFLVRDFASFFLTLTDTFPFILSFLIKKKKKKQPVNK